MSLSNPSLTLPLSKGGKAELRGPVRAIANRPFAFCSLITAVASYCDAKAHQGRWLVRIEDTDIPRIYPGSEEHILHAMDAFEFEPYGEIIYQKERLDIYENVIQQLRQRSGLCLSMYPQNAGLQSYLPRHLS